MNKLKIAMIGTGDISGIYLKNLTETFLEIELIGVCDLIREKSERVQKEYGIPKLYDSMYDAFNDDEVDIILNLTRPYEHYGVTKAALEAGKHVYSEKPLGATLEEGTELAEIAHSKKLFLGGAPDTFLGAGIQTCRKLIDDGFIGEIVGASAFMICRGHEGWHPDPEFYYKHGGGPMLDMGPYYVTALINLLGGIKGVTGVTKASFPQRMITSEPKRGTVINVDVPTFVTGILDFESGATGTLFTTFDVHYNNQARFEVYGSKGTLIVPDPNVFGGPVLLYRPEEGEYREMPMLFDYSENSRGLGLADMAKGIMSGRSARASYKQTLHVLEVMTAFERSSEKRGYEEIKTKFKREEPMKNNPIHGILD